MEFKKTSLAVNMKNSIPEDKNDSPRKKRILK